MVWFMYFMYVDGRVSFVPKLFYSLTVVLYLRSSQTPPEFVVGRISKDHSTKTYFARSKFNSFLFIFTLHYFFFIYQRDPAIERYGWIRENPDLYFKFKPRSVFYAVMCCMVVPGALYVYTKVSQVSFPLSLYLWMILRELNHILLSRNISC